jgi:hypothetical protein
MRTIIPTKVLSQEPFIVVFDSNIEEETLAFLESLPIENKSLEADEHRLASVLYSHLSTEDFLFLTDIFIKRIQEVLGITYERIDAEPLQIAKYPKGGFFSSHADFMNQDLNMRHTKRDRIATAILYLNDDYKGGTTFFEKLDLHVHPKRGQILYYEYNPLKTSLDVNMKTLHAGSKVEEGEKRIVVQLFLEKEYEQ